MKTILIDAVHTFINEHGIIDKKINELLDQYDHPKIIVTNMSVEKFQELAMDLLPYPVFTLSGEPRKSNPEYFQILMQEYNIFPDECLYFEHDKEALKAAQQLGIKTHYFDSEKKDYTSLQEFLAHYAK